MPRVLRIAALSGLIALFPAFFVALLLPEVPLTSAIIVARVCGPDAELIRRVEVRDLTSRSVTVHCRDAAGTVSESVSMAVFLQGMRLGWPPTALAIGLVWWSVLLARRNNAERRAGEASREGVTGGGVGSTGARTAGAGSAAIVDRIVSADEATHLDVRDLLEALAREGTAMSVEVTRDERTVDLGSALRSGSDARGRVAADRATGASGVAKAGASVAGGPGEVEASLRELQRLLERGLITREEHETRRRAVLERAFG